MRDWVPVSCPKCTSSAHHCTVSVEGHVLALMNHVGGLNPKEAERKEVLFGDVYGDITPKETCTCRVRAHGGGVMG